VAAAGGMEGPEHVATCDQYADEATVLKVTESM
jgi:hypothetical protein